MTLQSDVAALWHARLGHMPINKVQSLGLFPKHAPCDSIKQCSMCPKAKQHRFPFPHSQIHSTHVFYLIHLDLWGPYGIQTHNDEKYFLTIANDYSRIIWRHLLATKRNVWPLIIVEMVNI